MKKNHFIRIFAAYILIVLVGVTVTGLFSIQLFKYYFAISAQTRMKSNIQLIKDSIVDQLAAGNNVDYDYLAKKYSEDIGSSVTFISSNGTILGERMKGINKNVNFLANPEVVEAKQNGYGDLLFYNKELKVYILNVASYISTDKFNGYIHISTPVKEVTGVNNGIMSYTLIGVIFMLISSGILRVLFEKDIIGTLKKITDNSYKVGTGEFGSRVDIKSDDTIGVLVEEYNSMLERIQFKINEVYLMDDKIKEGLNSMHMGVAIVDSDNRIQFANPFILELLGSESDSNSIRGQKVLQLIKNTKITKLLKDSLENNQALDSEIVLESERIIKVSVSPVTDDKNNSKGCFIIAYDITKIKKLEMMGSDFVTNVTHELRTPLTSIKGFVETLKDGAIEDKEVSYKFLDIIDAECDRLNSLINDILQLSQLQNVKRDTNLELNNIQDIIREVVVFLDNQIKKKDITVLVHLDENIPLMLINKDRIKQMFINIVDNAVKYTQPGGKVEIKAEYDGEYVNFSVKDNGIGIPEDAIPRLFERFYRVDKGRSRSMGGTGLGLSIVKHIVNLYNGTIDVKSKIGKGTEFIIRLPKRAA